MLGIVNGIMTIVAMLTFLGIVWWAFSRGRTDANHEASLLPFAVPDERLMNNNEGSSHE